MSLHKNYDDHSISEYKFEDINEAVCRKKVNRLIEDRLERKILQAEFQDDLDELSGEDFDWDEINK